MKIIDIIEIIKKNHEPFEENENTRDQILAGDPNQICSGICVSVCATFDVLKQAKAKNCNLIITHESIFYGSRIDADDLKEDEIIQAKRKYIEDNHLVIWRDHDRIHGNAFNEFQKRLTRDHIFYGICKELGWEEYVVDDSLKPCWYKIPEMDAKDLVNLLIEKFNLSGLRVVGNLNHKVSSIWFCEHVNGSKRDEVKLQKAQKADVMIPLEICDYTLTQYVRDANACGQVKILLEMGHFNCEELGMKYFKEWLKEILDEAINVEFIQSGDLFQYIGGTTCQKSFYQPMEKWPVE